MWHYRTMPSPALIPRADPRQPRSQVHTRTGSKWNLWNYISRYHWQSALDGLPEKFFLIYRPTETSKTPLSYYSTDGIATTDSSVLYGIPLPVNLQCPLLRPSGLPRPMKGPELWEINRLLWPRWNECTWSNLILINYRTSTQICCLTNANFTWANNQWPITTLKSHIK